MFVDCKTDFDCHIRDHAAMPQVGTPAQLIRLYKMMLSNCSSSLKVGVFRQGDPLPCDHFNFVTENVTQNAGVYYNLWLPYADDIGRTKRDFAAAFNSIE